MCVLRESETNAHAQSVTNLNVVMLQSTLWTLFNNRLEAECFAAIPKDHEAPLVKTNGSAFTSARLQSRTCASLNV